MQGSCAVSNRSWSLISAAGVIALLPLAAPQSAQNIAPAAMLEGRVVTATSPLDLASLTAADFGDTDAAR